MRQIKIQTQIYYQMLSMFGIPIAWYKARIPVFPRKSTREGASSLFGPGPERPKIVSGSRATPRLHRCKSGFALEQEIFWGLSGRGPKRLLAPSLVNFSIPSKWTRPFWGTGCRRCPKSLSSAQAQPLFAVPALRELEVLAGLVFCEMPSQYSQSAFQGSHRIPEGSAPVCDPNPPRPFARYRFLF